MKDRIRQIMEAQHMSQQEFASYIGTNPATLSGIFNERTRPSINIVEIIKKKFPDISLDWLMFGMGDMYQHKSAASDVKTAAVASPSVPHAQIFDQEPILNFETPVAPSPTMVHQPKPNFNGVKNTYSENNCGEVKVFDKHERHVTEIRVYYDDQTWESFVPSKK